jgi:hypothetical protein
MNGIDRRRLVRSAASLERVAPPQSVSGHEQILHEGKVVIAGAVRRHSPSLDRADCAVERPTRLAERQRDVS